jgi:hypothetical protein
MVERSPTGQGGPAGGEGTAQRVRVLDEMSAPTRSIRGDQIQEIRQTSPGWQIVVDDTVEPDEDTHVQTRGA